VDRGKIPKCRKIQLNYTEKRENRRFQSFHGTKFKFVLLFLIREWQKMEVNT
jgi:hypothetical protein